MNLTETGGAFLVLAVFAYFVRLAWLMRKAPLVLTLPDFAVRIVIPALLGLYGKWLAGRGVISILLGGWTK